MRTAPVDAAAAFARLYHQWFDDACGQAAESARQAQALAGSYVADVLTLWDESTRSWVRGAPTILRLEACDLASFTMRAPHIALYLGSIDTDPSSAAFGSSMRWESFRPCSYAIGRTVADLVFNTDEQGLLIDVEAVLDDGGRLALGYLAAWELPCAG